jgi:hypothetical protein
MSRIALSSVLLTAALPAIGATVTYVGYDLTTSGAWRTAGVAKPLDADGNNIYGSAGYLLTTSPGGAQLSNPAYASVINLVSTFYSGHVTNPNYTTVDNPLGGSVKTGIWYATGAFADEEQDFVRLTVSQAANFRIGIMVDETDFIGISPGELRVRQTVGGSGDSTLVNAMVEANLDTDWYFFDILGAQPGDQFVISGTDSRVGSGPVTSNGIGAITFDTVAVPEASTWGAIIFAGTTLAWTRLKARRSSIG